MENGTYTVPKGNLFPEGMANTRPEIYIMGVRNPYSLTVDPVRRWIGWGDVGPDKIMNPAKPVMPANINWGKEPRGRDTLPPAVHPTLAYLQGAAIGGPFYRYDGDLNSSVKFPPHFQRKWFVTELGKGSPIVAITLSEDGKTRLAQDTLLKNIKLFRPLDFLAGPDGALYVLNYAGSRSSTAETGIVRIEYTGDCRPSLPKLPVEVGI